MRRLVLYTDESARKDRFFSHFFGGVSVFASDQQEIEDNLIKAASEVGINAELKWVKVSTAYLDRYKVFVDRFFDEVDSGRLKVRIMFSQNVDVFTGSRQSADETYSKLYYQFLKHAFGLQHAADPEDPISVHLFMDQLPLNTELRTRFRNYLLALNSSQEFKDGRIVFASDRISEVDSSRHIILQGLDIVLGSMRFRLNDSHKVKPAGAKRRAKKTIAKEQLYKHINKRIQNLRANFNIGISTGTDGDIANRWAHEYRHWKFMPSNAVRDMTKAKP